MATAYPHLLLDSYESFSEDTVLSKLDTRLAYSQPSFEQLLALLMHESANLNRVVVKSKIKSMLLDVANLALIPSMSPLESWQKEAYAILRLGPSYYATLGAQDGLADLSGSGRISTPVGSFLIGRAVGPYTNGATDIPGSYEKITTNYSTRRNLVTNPSFEINTTGGTLSRVTSEAQSGSAALQVVCAGTAINEGITMFPGAPITAGAAYTASAYVKAPVGALLSITLYDADAAAALISPPHRRELRRHW